jgi:hypothetical protein
VTTNDDEAVMEMYEGPGVWGILGSVVRFRNQQLKKISASDSSRAADPMI